ncbi:MAG: zinc-binding dehydrogenase [Candidatus Tectomicrobia bacterium]|nr:zinc-binding dehydrogenase [Candidatus Tectomicrobia bacterium]
MRALVKTAKGPGQMALLDIEEPRTGPGQVKVRVARAGICGTDVHIASGEFFHYVPPLALGHEFAGVVAEVGEGVSGIAAGERVTAEPTKRTCGECPHCRSGHYNRCERREIAGVVSHGAFTDFVVTRAASIHKLPASVSFTAAALSEPLAVCVHGMTEQCSLKEGDTVLVCGPGAIGLSCLQVARALGARVIVAGTRKDAHRLALAGKLGAERAVTVEEGDLRAAVAGLTGGWGVDMAIEAAGAAPAFKTCLESVRKGGQILQVGIPGRPVEVDMSQVTWKEVRIAGTFGQKDTAWRTAIRLMEEKRVDMEALVSDILPLGEWERGFRLMEQGGGLKVLLEPGR